MVLGRCGAACCDLRFRLGEWSFNGTVRALQAAVQGSSGQLMPAWAPRIASASAVVSGAQAQLAPQVQLQGHSW